MENDPIRQLYQQADDIAELIFDRLPFVTVVAYRMTSLWRYNHFPFAKYTKDRALKSVNNTALYSSIYVQSSYKLSTSCCVKYKPNGILVTTVI